MNPVFLASADQSDALARVLGIDVKPALCGMQPIEALAQLRTNWLPAEDLLSAGRRIRRECTNKGLVVDETDETIEETLLVQAFETLHAGRAISRTQLVDLVRYATPSKARLLTAAEEHAAQCERELRAALRKRSEG